MKVAIYGGSFNPPHIGHAWVCQWLLWTGKADIVHVVPSAGHPLGKTHMDFDFRVKLLQAMAHDVDPHIQISKVETELPKPVYTYDLLTHLQEKAVEGVELRFVIGADILEESHKWHKWDQVHDEFELIVLGREGYPSPDGSPIIPDFSSSEIRRLIEAGDERWKDMVTPGVRELLPGPYSSN
jgi:nicotinate-nucleotide adenylyltransferase